jgi:hypothetical protein
MGVCDFGYVQQMSSGGHAGQGHCAQPTAGFHFSHFPATQTLSLSHRSPQLPQFCGSFIKSTQALSQPVAPFEHRGTHAPPSHLGYIPEQTLPTSPQFDGSVCKSTQLPLTRVSPGLHEH